MRVEIRQFIGLVATLVAAGCSGKPEAPLGRDGKPLTDSEYRAIRADWDRKKREEDHAALREKRAREEELAEQQRRIQSEALLARTRMLAGLTPQERKDFEDREAREALMRQNQELLEELRKANAQLRSGANP